MEPKKLTPEELEQIRAREVKRRVLERAAGVIGFPRALKPYGAELDRLMLLGHIAALEAEAAAEREQSESWQRKRLAWKIAATRQGGRAEKAEADLAAERERTERLRQALEQIQQHLEIVGGPLARRSTAYRIAASALAAEGGE